MLSSKSNSSSVLFSVRTRAFKRFTQESHLHTHSTASKVAILKPRARRYAFHPQACHPNVRSSRQDPSAGRAPRDVAHHTSNRLDNLKPPPLKLESTLLHFITHSYSPTSHPTHPPRYETLYLLMHSLVRCILHPNIDPVRGIHSLRYTPAAG